MDFGLNLVKSPCSYWLRHVNSQWLFWLIQSKSITFEKQAHKLWSNVIPHSVDFGAISLLNPWTSEITITVIITIIITIMCSSVFSFFDSWNMHAWIVYVQGYWHLLVFSILFMFANIVLHGYDNWKMIIIMDIIIIFKILIIIIIIKHIIVYKQLLSLLLKSLLLSS